MTLPLNRPCTIRGLALSLALLTPALSAVQPVMAPGPPPAPAVAPATAKPASPEQPATATPRTARPLAATALPPGPVERGQPLRLVAGKSTLLSLPHDIVRISVGNPDVADVVLTHPREVYLLGKKSGQTNLMLWGKGSVTRLHDIAVSTDTET